jgi:hypothetical protein
LIAEIELERPVLSENERDNLFGVTRGHWKVLGSERNGIRRRRELAGRVQSLGKTGDEKI